MQKSYLYAAGGLLAATVLAAGLVVLSQHRKPQSGAAADAPGLYKPRALSFGPDGGLYIVDSRNNRIEKRNAAGSLEKRFGRLGVIASMQPLHSNPDSDTLEVWAGNIGPERAARAWVWKSIAEAGGRYAFGSDWPVVTLNPLEGIQTAVTRQTKEGLPKDGFVPSQRLSIAQAVEGYTLGAAFAGHREKTEGSLVPDKVADVIILDRNIFEIDPHTIGDTKVVTTIVGGKIVYEAEAK